MTALVGALRGRLLGLLHLDDPPWRIALALAVGVFISVTPFLGFQTLLALLIATVFRLNKAATVTGTWLNLPWIMPLVYAGALWLGESIVGTDASFTLALLVGSAIVGGVAAVVTWVVAFGVMTARARRRARRRVTDAVS
ncbi:MAG TPA: DUF2062 domain-containing protein [Methylomirabilota bacterium]|jgi:uncharacterized protein (DUF2062 family)|nr:DUF2062 domain-containing protein [Methylomirabilota bacterium]